MRTSGFAALKRSRARPHPKPAGPQSAAERREECRHGGMNPADLHAEGNARGGGERAPASELPPQPRQRRGRAAPAKAAHRRASGGAVAASGAAIPERRPRAAR